MMDKKDLLALGKIVSSADPKAPTAYSFGEEKFSYKEAQEALRYELNEMTKTPALWRENRNTVFELLEQTFDDVLPKKVMEQYGSFAEIKTLGQGQKAVFTQRITTAAKRRAKQFITKVGLAGRYETFKLDGRSYEVPTSAFGGAAQIGFEEFLDGRVQMSDVYDIVLEGLDEAIYVEIERALKASVQSLQAANLSKQTSFDEGEMDRLLQIADSYGQSTIYCTYEFAATMVPAEGWVSNDMKNEKWNNGYLANYKGHRVIILNQSFEDETNAVKVIDPAYAYIIPTGAEKPVKVVFEGQTVVRETENQDLSREIQTYKKVGVGALVTNNICVYVNTSLTK